MSLQSPTNTHYALLWNNLENATEVLNPAKFMHMLSFAQVNNPLEVITFMYSRA